MNVAIENHGTIVLLRPLTGLVRSWLEEHTDGTWWGGALAAEPRYVPELLYALTEALS
jgi:hypothetical protein